MDRKIEIDCSNIENVSKKVLENANEFKSISDELNTIIDSIDGCWQGVDSTTFKTNANGFIYELNFESTYLEGWSTFLSSASKVYKSNVDNYYPLLENANNDLSSINYS